MCYVIGIKIPKKQTIKIGDKNIDLDPIDIPVQSGFAYQQWPVIYKEDANGEPSTRPGLMHWELIPNWVRNQKELAESRKKYTTLNLKGETILTNKAAQAVIHTNRCIILASHFFEWQQIEKEKYPFCITIPNQPIFYMAGVWNTWKDFSNGNLINSFGLITTEANSFMSKIHNVKKRMPTILTEDLATTWLEENLSPHQIVSIATHKFDEDKMQAFTVAKNFQQVQNPIEKVDYKIFTPQSLF